MDRRLPLDGRASGLMLLLCLTWGLQQISLKAAAPLVSPATMIGLRSGIALVLIMALGGGWAAWRQSGLTRWRPGVLAGALFAIEYLMVAQALKLTHASHVVVLLYTSPIFAAVGLHWRLPAERLVRRQWLGIGLAFVGIALAFLGRAPQGAMPEAPAVLLGDLLALLAGASWGATTVCIRCSSLSSAPPAETLMWQLGLACALLLPAAWLLGEARFTPVPLAWAHLAFQSLVVSSASFLVWFWLLRHYQAAPLGAFSFLTPVFGVVLGLFLLGEPIEARFLGGSVLVLGGVWLASRR
ncbi:DMT family transporter [Ideonella sp. 4Y11]|uniref:DMT family transporter n=1 Tax=Ideonella aquatica TaxID=2824119 RepID=A0A940YJD8_9BURK|nr:DMT family transporter [Ideonella aquatica]MBQ0959151.1 DMT family transporter [Ideonella aquatica]